MKRLLYFLIISAFFGFAGWWVTTHPDFLQYTREIYDTLIRKPCKRPVTYRIGTLDPRFHINSARIADILTQAEQIWETPTAKDLFAYDQSGEVVVDLVYDYRQETTDKLKTLGISIDDTRAGYDVLKTRYTALLAEYMKEQTTFDALYRQFQEQNAQYEAAFRQWSADTRRSQSNYDALVRQQNEVKASQSKTIAAQASLNATIENYNTVVTALNKVAAHLDAVVDTYNTIGTRQGKEFNEGLYQSNETGRRITIYEFQNESQLVRVLAHEMGHALGLDHSDNPDDIMYRLNESKNDTLTAQDIVALRVVCRW